MAGLPLARRPFDILICVFYGVQIPIAGFLDSQSGVHLEQAQMKKSWTAQFHLIQVASS